MRELREIRTGGAFIRPKDNKTYIAVCLSPDPFDVMCLDVETKKIECFEESEIVQSIPDWCVQVKNCQDSKSEGDPLDILY